MKESRIPPTRYFRFCCSHLVYLPGIFIIIFLLGITGSGISDPGVPLKQKYRQMERLVSAKISYEEELPLYAYVVEESTRLEAGQFPGWKIVLSAGSFTASSDESLPVESYDDNYGGGVIEWREQCEWIEWSVDIPASGLYEIAVDYLTLPGSGAPVQRALLIDGQYPFLEARNLIFPRLWSDNAGKRINNVGDEVRPRQIELHMWTTAVLQDGQRMYREPFQFHLSKGTHLMRMEYVDEPVVFGAIIIKASEPLIEYADYRLANVDAKAGSRVMKIQAENAVLYKSDPTIRRESSGDPLCEPLSRRNRVLNIVGGQRWRDGGQSVTWEFSVPTSGKYKIALRDLQSWSDGLPTHRQVLIDGRVPFREMQEYRFDYHPDWKMEELTDQFGEPYEFFLDSGSHTLSMTVMMGSVSTVIRDLAEDSLLISSIIRQIIMLTGSIPDRNFSYEVETKLPGILEELEYLRRRMQNGIDALGRVSKKRSAIINDLALIKDQLQDMIDDPETIPRKLDDLKYAQNSLGTWMVNLKSQPLAVDYFVFCPVDTEIPDRRANFMQKFVTTFSNFIGSFAKDYDRVGNVYSEDDETVLNVWIARGKEWGEIIKEMVDEDFSSQTGIHINMNILPASQLNTGKVNTLMLAISSGIAPDVGLGVNGNSPVEFAMRDAVVDLSRFDDYPLISKRFVPELLVPFRYREGTFALPETMNFTVLFYRKDILSELGISLPETWEDLYNTVLPVLYQNGLEFYYPLNFAPFLFQHGAKFYNAQGTKSALDSPEAYRAFKEWTELYTSYGVPTVANFYNRLRTGEMPMGIHGYQTFIRLSVGAPELFGRWGIALVPGRRLPDGSIDRTVGAIPGMAGPASGGSVVSNLTGECAIILKQSEHPNEAWEFLKWWTSDEIQGRFGKELEALMGVEARWNTANRKAFTELPFTREDKAVITEQWKWFKMGPVVPGGYFTLRHVSNAWNRVVLGGMNVRDSLEQAVEDINVELWNKQEEYGYTSSER